MVFDDFNIEDINITLGENGSLQFPEFMLNVPEYDLSYLKICNTPDYQMEQYLSDDSSTNRPGLSKLYDFENLINAFKKCKNGVSWKRSVQEFGLNSLVNICRIKKELSQGIYQLKPMNEFEINERGHIRDIKSHKIEDRVIQRCLNDNILLPAIDKTLIYDNGASRLDMGLSFSRRRFKFHLINAFREYGPGAYILITDFSKFFDNIRHQIAIEIYSKYLNEDELWFVEMCFNQFEVDVSYLSDDEYDICMDIVFNSLDYSKISNEVKTGEKFMEKSIGIGSQLSQITGLVYPSSIDELAKTVLGIKYYGRYMDDSYAILRSKEECRYVESKIKEECDRLGIFMNQKKTRIQPITSWISYLKINYSLTNTGGVIEKVNTETFAREIRRIHKFFILFLANRMTLREITACYIGWRGTYIKFDSRYEIREVDFIFKKVFCIPKEVKMQDILIYVTINQVQLGTKIRSGGN